MKICLQYSFKSFLAIKNQALEPGTVVEKVKETLYDEKFTQLKEINSFKLRYILSRDLFQFCDHIGLKKIIGLKIKHE